jgi:hypothetical protein
METLHSNQTLSWLTGLIMFSILAGIFSLIQYKNEVECSLEKTLQLERCVCCGRSNPWRHGSYPRDSDRLNRSCNSLNPIFIQRYYCPIDYIGFFYHGVLSPRALRNAMKIFEELLDLGADMSDYIPVMRQMQYDLDMVMV